MIKEGITLLLVCLTLRGSVSETDRPSAPARALKAILRAVTLKGEAEKSSYWYCSYCGQVLTGPRITWGIHLRYAKKSKE